MRPPEHVTFTGASDPGQIEAMHAIWRKFPRRIEWGILLSESRAGTGRYPSRDSAKLLFLGLRPTSAHVCGRLADLLFEQYHRFHGAMGSWLPADLGPGYPPQAIQINHAKPDPWQLKELREKTGKRVIGQCRGRDFPRDRGNEWLFDQSGGRGEIPRSIPPHYQKRLVGYAGGIGPANVLQVIERINGASGSNIGPYWIDMESSLRTANDRFDLAAVELVLQTIEAAFPGWASGDSQPEITAEGMRMPGEG